jgi:DNA-directed RNA polymerase subunit RPC12/RpoP
MARTLVDLKDITGIEYECLHCHARYTVPIEKIDRPVFDCPNCKEQWISSETPPDSDFADARAIDLFLKFLKELQNRHMGATLRIEVSVDANNGKLLSNPASRA